ncbi:MAG: hypothetical protein IH987_10200 [Planctomycetes bacterium]|nr:hypothetical protein [Planctomycetota bacterium]
MGRSSLTESACIFQPFVITPTYENAGTLLDVLVRIEAVGVPIMVINHVSTDGTANALCKWQLARHPTPIWVETHPRNCGRAAAL